MSDQVKHGLQHFGIGSVLNGAFMLGGELFGPLYFLVFSILIGVIGFHRELVRDWGQHLSGFAVRFQYSINPANIDFGRLQGHMLQAIAWPVSSLLFIIGWSVS